MHIHKQTHKVVCEHLKCDKIYDVNANFYIPLLFVHYNALSNADYYILL